MRQQIEGCQFLTTAAVLVEIGNALSRRFRNHAVAIIEWILVSPEVNVVHVSAELFARAFDLFKAHQDKEWGLTDCISFVVMRDAGVSEAATNDHHFEQA